MQTTSSPTVATPQPATPLPEWTIDAAHSHVGFSVRHLMIANVRGTFHKLDGTVAWDPARPDAPRVDVEIDVASIDTREEKRDQHLRSADFFDAENFPVMTFRSRGVGKRHDGTVELLGDLTIRGTSRMVVLEVDGPSAEQADPWGNIRVAATARTTLKRSEFGMTWNTALETGGVLVGDDIKVEIELQLVRKK